MAAKNSFIAALPAAIVLVLFGHACSTSDTGGDGSKGSNLGNVQSQGGAASAGAAGAGATNGASGESGAAQSGGASGESGAAGASGEEGSASSAGAGQAGAASGAAGAAGTNGSGGACNEEGIPPGDCNPPCDFNMNHQICSAEHGGTCVDAICHWTKSDLSDLTNTTCCWPRDPPPGPVPWTCQGTPNLGARLCPTAVTWGLPLACGNPECVLAMGQNPSAGPRAYCCP